MKTITAFATALSLLALSTVASAACNGYQTKAEQSAEAPVIILPDEAAGA